MSLLSFWGKKWQNSVHSNLGLPTNIKTYVRTGDEHPPAPLQSYSKRRGWPVTGNPESVRFCSCNRIVSRKGPSFELMYHYIPWPSHNYLMRSLSASISALLLPVSMRENTGNTGWGKGTGRESCLNTSETLDSFGDSFCEAILLLSWPPSPFWWNNDWVFTGFFFFFFLYKPKEKRTDAVRDNNTPGCCSALAEKGTNPKTTRSQWRNS